MSHREIEMGRLQTVIGEARQLGGPAGKMAVALVEVVGTCHEWNTTSAEVAGGAIPLNDAINQILDAVQRGLDSPPQLLPAGATPMMITDDIALNMAAAVLDAMGHEEVAAGLRLLLPEAEGKVQGQPHQERTGKWGRPGHTAPRMDGPDVDPDAAETDALATGRQGRNQLEVDHDAMPPLFRYEQALGYPLTAYCRICGLPAIKADQSATWQHVTYDEAARQAAVRRQRNETGAAMPSEGGQPAFFSERPDGQPWGAPTGQPEAEAVLAVKVSDDGRVKFMLGAPALRPGIYEGTVTRTGPTGETR